MNSQEDLTVIEVLSEASGARNRLWGAAGGRAPPKSSKIYSKDGSGWSPGGPLGPSRSRRRLGEMISTCFGNSPISGPRGFREDFYYFGISPPVGDPPSSALAYGSNTGFACNSQHAMLPVQWLTNRGCKISSVAPKITWQRKTRLLIFYEIAPGTT